MAGQRILVISGAGLTVHRRHGRKLPAPFAFAPHDEGHARFARYIERHPNDVTRVIADVVEETPNPLGDWFRIGDRFEGLADQTRSVTESRGYALAQGEG